MHLQVYTGTTEPHSNFHAHAEWRVRRALQRWQRHLSSARLFVQQDHKRCGDSAAKCRLVLRGRHEGEIVARGRGIDVERALADALARARRRLRDREKRKVKRARRGMDRRKHAEAA